MNKYDKTIVEKYCEEVIKSFIETHNLQNLTKGMHRLNDTDYVIKTSYELIEVEESFIESHLEYLDVHYIIDGSEQIRYDSFGELQIIENYCVKNDCFILKGDLKQKINLHPTEYLILKPTQPHMTKLKADSKTVDKLIFKIKI